MSPIIIRAHFEDETLKLFAELIANDPDRMGIMAAAMRGYLRGSCFRRELPRNMVSWVEMFVQGDLEFNALRKYFIEIFCLMVVDVEQTFEFNANLVVLGMGGLEEDLREWATQCETLDDLHRLQARLIGVLAKVSDVAFNAMRTNFVDGDVRRRELYIQDERTMIKHYESLAHEEADPANEDEEFTG